MESELYLSVLTDNLSLPPCSTLWLLLLLLLIKRNNQKHFSTHQGSQILWVCVYVVFSLPLGTAGKIFEFDLLEFCYPEMTKTHLTYMACSISVKLKTI